MIKTGVLCTELVGGWGRKGKGGGEPEHRRFIRASQRRHVKRRARTIRSVPWIFFWWSLVGSLFQRLPVRRFSTSVVAVCADVSFDDFAREVEFVIPPVRRGGVLGGLEHFGGWGRKGKGGGEPEHRQFGMAIQGGRYKRWARTNKCFPWNSFQWIVFFICGCCP